MGFASRPGPTAHVALACSHIAQSNMLIVCLRCMKSKSASSCNVRRKLRSNSGFSRSNVVVSGFDIYVDIFVILSNLMLPLKLPLFDMSDYVLNIDSV